jgi:hypothetical protein
VFELAMTDEKKERERNAKYQNFPMSVMVSDCWRKSQPC